MGTNVQTKQGHELYEDGDQIRLKKDGVTVMLPGPGPDLQEFLDSVILCADAIVKRRSREQRFRPAEKEKVLERGCDRGRGPG